MNTEDKLLQDAYSTIEKLRHAIKKRSNESEVDIAIVGVGCQLPGGITSLDKLWSLLKEGGTVATNIPATRWQTANSIQYAGIIDNVFEFDNAYFSISPVEARHMDPQHRLLLMRTEEALISANIKPSDLYDSDTGVFIGIGNTDYYQRIALNANEPIDAYIASGNSPSMAAGRISHYYGFKGPSVSFDTACSSSLYGIHQACISLRRGECKHAVVGAVNLILTPLIHENFTNAGMLAKDGKCKVFSNNADGYVRSEGCVVLVLTTKSLAEKNGYPVLGIIKGSAVNHDGHSQGITVPHGPSQAAVIKNALEQSNIIIDKVDYLEAHGTGTSLGDPIEVTALNSVFSQRKRPLLIGSIKANVGHLEIAAGMASILKALCIFHYRIFPEQPNISKLNEHINWDSSKITVDHKLYDPPATSENMIIGISGFGFSGTNAHLILSSTDKPLLSLPTPRVDFKFKHFEVPLVPRIPISNVQDVPDQCEESWENICDIEKRNDYQKIVEHANDINVEIRQKEQRYISLMQILEKYCLMTISRLPQDILPEYEKLYYHLRKRIEESHHVDDVTIISWDSLISLYEEYVTQIDFLKNCLNALPDILTGKQEAVKFLFEGGEDSRAISLYRDNNTGVYFNQQIKKAVTAYLNGSKSRNKKRILEVGGGSGSTANYVLEGLSEFDVTYVFTDVSSYFLHLAEKKFKKFDNVEYALCDITKPIPDELGSFDIIIAANVIHATPLVAQAINYLKKALSSNGILILRECTRETLTADMTFGINVGWWLFENDPERNGYPLLSSTKWHNILKNCGFQNVSILDAEANAYEHVIIATQYNTVLPRIIISENNTQISDTDVHYSWFDNINWRESFKKIKIENTSDFEIVFFLDFDINKNEEISELWKKTFIFVVTAIQILKESTLHNYIKFIFIYEKKESILSCIGSSMSALCRVAKIEVPQIHFANILLSDISDGYNYQIYAQLVAQILKEPEIYFDGKALYARRLSMLSYKDNLFTLADVNKSYLIFGASGGLGMATANWLLSKGAQHIVLCARNIETSAIRQFITKAEARNIRVEVVAIDVADNVSMEKLFNQFGNQWPALKGIFYAAGVGGDCLIENITSENILPGMIDTKVKGILNCHMFSIKQPLDLFVVYSSVITTWGAKARAHYAAVNAFAVELVRMRKLQKLPALVVDWGPWNNTGMISEESSVSALEVGMKLIDASSYLEALDKAIASDKSHVILAKIDWDRLQKCYINTLSKNLFDNIVTKYETKPSEMLPQKVSSEIGVDQLKAIFAKVLGYAAGDENIDIDRGLYDHGLDSLLALDFVDDINAAFNAKISLSDIFSHPTIRSLADLLVSQNNTTKLDKEVSIINNHSQKIAIIGMACDFPGAEDISQFWNNLINSTLSITPIPSDRYFSEEFKSSGYKAGFIDNIFDFDADYFSISAAEALYMDPQQRLMLQTVQKALLDAGFQKGQKLPLKTAVIVGASGSDYGHLCLNKFTPLTPYSITGNSLNSIAGRVSYYLGVQGPSFAVDSACSSSLVAMSLALQYLKNGTVDLAIVGGVNCLLNEESSSALLKTTVLSANYQCLPFSDNANGMVRGEGCGVLVLMREDDAINQNRSAYASLLGATANQDGDSVQLTAPNGKAQASLLRETLVSLNLKPEDLTYIEAHGTATALGDPIELNAIREVYGGNRPYSPLYIGSVKGNIGHLEAASGIASVIKVALMCYHKTLAPTINDNTLISRFDWNVGDIRLCRDVETLTKKKNFLLTMGVSSFGFSGTNAHAILTEFSGLAKEPNSQKINFKKTKYRLEPSFLPTIFNHDIVYANQWFLVKDLEVNKVYQKRNSAVVIYMSKSPIIETLQACYEETYCIDIENIHRDFLRVKDFSNEVVFIFNSSYNFGSDLPDLHVKKANYLIDALKLIRPRTTLITCNEESAGLECGYQNVVDTYIEENPICAIAAIHISVLINAESLLLLINTALKNHMKSLKLSDDRFYELKLTRIVDSRISSLKSEDDVYLITGGTGSIGQDVIRHLLSQGVKKIAIVSRGAFNFNNEKIPREDVKYIAADITNLRQFKSAIDEINAYFGPITHVYHLAGTIKDTLITNLTSEDFNLVAYAKVIGAYYCHQLTLSQPIKQFILFSSACVYLGGRGQGAYRYANSFLHELASYRQSNGLPAIALAIGPWENSNAINQNFIKHNLARMGINILPAQTMLIELEKIASLNVTAAGLFDVDWEKCSNLENLSLRERAYLSELLPAKETPRKDIITNIESEVVSAVTKVISDLSPNNINFGQPLANYGLASLGVIDLTDLLSKRFNMPLSPGFLYSYTTVEQIISYFQKNYHEKRILPVASNKESCAIVGMACCFGGKIQSLDDFIFLLDQGSSVYEMNNRPGWIMRLQEKAINFLDGKTSFMGLINDYDFFDENIFNLSPREAGCMDPQHRIALEVAWRALEDAGIDPKLAIRTQGGIFVGAGTSDYSQVVAQTNLPMDSFLGTGSCSSLLAGRLAYHFNWDGPVEVVDTACSSSLVALHNATKAIKLGNCDMALVGGVNLILTPNTTLLLDQAKALSPSGQCRPFSSEADGYVRAEGAAFIVIKRLSKAIEDNNRIYAVINGSAVNHDGRSQGITAPNGLAQQDVMRAALNDAEIVSDQVDFLETHGTGTILGDSVEMESIQSVYLNSRRSNPLYLGALKAAIGHTESVAGIAGVVKLALMLHYKRLSKEVPINRSHLTSVEFIQKTTKFDAKYVSVNSFGFSGTNANIILSGYYSNPDNFSPITPSIFNRRRYPVPGYDDGFMLSLQKEINLPDGSTWVQMDFSPFYPFNLRDHSLQKEIIVPASFYLVLIYKLYFSDQAICFKKIEFLSVCKIPSKSLVRLKINKTSNDFLVYTENQKNDLQCRMKLQYTNQYTLSSQQQFDFSWQDDAVKISTESYYEFLASQNVDLGPSFRTIENIWIAREKVICQIKAMDDICPLTPGVLDGFFQTIGVYLKFKNNKKDYSGARVPTFIEQIIQLRPIEFPCLVTTESHDEGVSFDIHVYSASGNLLMVIKGLTTVQLKSAEESLRMYAWDFKPSKAMWKESELCSRHIWMPSQGSIDSVLTQLKKDNSVRKLLIIDFQNSFSEDWISISKQFYQLSYFISKQNNFDSLQLQVLASDNIQPSSLHCLLGILKTLSLEYPGLPWIWHEFAYKIDVKDIQWWNGRANEHVYKHAESGTFTQRLCLNKLSLSAPIKIKKEQCIVIIGPTSNIAREITPLLEQQGIKIAYITRSQIDQQDCWQVDIFSTPALKNALADIEKVCGSILAVFHLIGSYKDGIFEQQSADSFYQVLHSKAESALAIAKALLSYHNSYLVLFSSAACIFGGMGQGSYSGANQYLHALARWTRDQGLKTICIAWPDWQLTNKPTVKHAIDIGLKSVTPEIALSLILRLMNTDQTIDAIFDIDWLALAALPSSRLLSNEFEEFLPQIIPEEKNSLVAQLKNLEITERRAAISETIRNIVCGILQIEACEEDTLLIRYGLESISLLELRETIFSTFKINISIADLFNQLTVSTIVDILLQSIDAPSKFSTSSNKLAELHELLAED